VNDQPGHCAGATHIMYPEKGLGGSWQVYARQVAAAKAVCQGCPLQLPCYSYAVQNREEHGVWGGVLFTSDRHNRHRKPANSGQCGTEAGWARHKRAADRDDTTVTCQPCADARRQAQTERTRRT